MVQVSLPFLLRSSFKRKATDQRVGHLYGYVEMECSQWPLIMLSMRNFYTSTVRSFQFKRRTVCKLE